MGNAGIFPQRAARSQRNKSQKKDPDFGITRIMDGNPKQSKDPFLAGNPLKPRTAGIRPTIALFGRNGVIPKASWIGCRNAQKRRYGSGIGAMSGSVPLK